MNNEKQQIKGILLGFAYTLKLDVDYRQQISRGKVRLKAPANKVQLDALNIWLSTKPAFDFELSSRIEWG
jgi:hypothetical protein